MHVFGPVKESFTFYEQPQNYMVQDKIVLK